MHKTALIRFLRFVCCRRRKTMTKPPIKKVAALQKPSLTKLKDPGTVFYRVAVNEALARGKAAEISKLLVEARKLQADLPRMIKDLEAHGG